MEQATEQSEDPFVVLDMLVESGFGWLGSDEAQDHLRMNIQLWSEALRSSQVMELFKEANVEIYRVALTKLMVRAQELGQIEASLDPEAAARVHPCQRSDGSSGLQQDPSWGR